MHVLTVQQYLCSGASCLELSPNTADQSPPATNSCSSLQPHCRLAISPWPCTFLPNRGLDTNEMDFPVALSIPRHGLMFSRPLLPPPLSLPFSLAISPLLTREIHVSAFCFLLAHPIAIVSVRVGIGAVIACCRVFLFSRRFDWRRDDSPAIFSRVDLDPSRGEECYGP